MIGSNAEQPVEGQLTDRLSAPRPAQGRPSKRAVTLPQRGCLFRLLWAMLSPGGHARADRVI